MRFFFHFFKIIIIKIFKLFSIKATFYRISKNIEYENINKFDWIPFLDKRDDKNYFFNLYQIGLTRSNSTKSDNFNKQLRFYSLFQLAKYSIKSNKKYNFAECGCWKGHSAYSISMILKEYNFKQKFYIFDSFEGGLSDTTIEDTDNEISSKFTKEKIFKRKKYFSSNYNDVRQILSDFDFIKIYKTWIPKKFDIIEQEKFQFVHLDVDLYKPTLDSLSFFYPRLIKGGILVCDDYNSTEFPGAKKAWDEYFSTIDVNFFYESNLGACWLIK